MAAQTPPPAGGPDTEVAVITGGASGFGLALADQCARRGMRVALLDIDHDRAVTEAGTLSARHGVAVSAVETDAASSASVDAAATAVADRYGRADLVVSNVGVQLFGAVERLTDREWQWVLDLNVIGAARTARAFLPLLRAAPKGRLAFTTSSSVLDPASRMGVYQAGKFAVWGLAETLRLELRDQVAVSVIFPSGMLSRHLESSAVVQPAELRRPIGDAADFEAMAASNPGMVQAPVSPDEAASNVADEVLAGTRYIVTHGDLEPAVRERSALLADAARRAFTRTSTA
ncbi:SDR family oxidoreductase [Nocardia sp. alder85J]|uniref:SDR family oxidoreductase n=1 Tax=Nocardia sp. alder85J TaxID=2862949 RepID=UPI001CD5234A|nr:SDR family oxidoreductase [Nocardia sp. alder85J]MCX4096749.1 SDR family NAD(P)-dependent oxidoreductase [Nocardia sp. alder85J]